MSSLTIVATSAGNRRAHSADRRYPHYRPRSQTRRTFAISSLFAVVILACCFVYRSCSRFFFLIGTSSPIRDALILHRVMFSSSHIHRTYSVYSHLFSLFGQGCIPFAADTTALSTIQPSFYTFAKIVRLLSVKHTLAYVSSSAVKPNLPLSLSRNSLIEKRLSPQFRRLRQNSNLYTLSYEESSTVSTSACTSVYQVLLYFAAGSRSLLFRCCSSSQ